MGTRPYESSPSTIAARHRADRESIMNMSFNDLPHPQPPPQQQQQQPLRQQQHYQPQVQQQQQHMAMNGMNGMAPNGLPGPTPAGHQAELNYIYGMVEELSRQLADNRRVTEDIVNGLGRVRARARQQGLNNDQVIEASADDINGQVENLDALISLLSESLEKARNSRDANAALLSQYASTLALLLKSFHEYKAKHLADVTAWHRSYRSQLDEARRENSKLREQIWEMQSHAKSANESLRTFRRQYEEDEHRWERRVGSVAMRQELRFWKRMAMPELEDDDTYWSGDDDIIDSAEKERLRIQHIRLQEQLLAVERADDSDDGGLPQVNQPFQPLGGVAMQRDTSSNPLAPPVLPPRPLSAASSTGSSGEPRGC